MKTIYAIFIGNVAARAGGGGVRRTLRGAMAKFDKFCFFVVLFFPADGEGGPCETIFGCAKMPFVFYVLYTTRAATEVWCLVAFRRRTYMVKKGKNGVSAFGKV